MPRTHQETKTNRRYILMTGRTQYLVNLWGSLTLNVPSFIVSKQKLALHVALDLHTNCLVEQYKKIVLHYCI